MYDGEGQSDASTTFEQHDSPKGVDNPSQESNNGRPALHSHLYTVRLWKSRRTKGAEEWCGRVQHVISGEAHSFQGWLQLLNHLEEMSAMPGAVGEVINEGRVPDG
jgi:hypothetical protein